MLSEASVNWKITPQPKRQGFTGLAFFQITQAMIDLYQYIAENDEMGSLAIASRYGYSTSNVQTANDMADLLEAIVAEQGEEAFKRMMDLHPDKDVILDMYVSKPAAGEKKPCGCKEKVKAQVTSNTTAGIGLQQGNLFLMASALLLAVAIITSKK